LKALANVPNLNPIIVSFFVPFMVGLPDLFVFLKPGIVLLFEVKAPNGKLSKGQEKFRDEMSQMSQHYYILKSIDDLIKILNSYQVMV